MDNTNFKITEADESHWAGIWEILQPTFNSGDTYAYPPGIAENDAKHYWIECPQRTYVGIYSGQIVGTYYIKPNQPGLGSHICNMGFVVSRERRGLGTGTGTGTKLAQHAFDAAKKLGFHAVQANLVVSTNTKAIKLWESLGFSIIGTIPDGFNLHSKNFVDAFIMYKKL